ncbi:hypothetical protein FNJ84_18510 [Paracoccus sp. M683]|uniref:hypothetical protein n=1 Tax=Paracoccus sp. M683 TaxID=2594268 RepID=UPI00117C6E5D|nr:hypothetical protein [Paracoccus sp. M683]TRW94855.1 hypothetical protein FNJ84_18510 [Paracoccus sp. M683]
MIEFILVACLTGAPDSCRTETRLLTDMTLIQCMTSAQFLAADWAKDHPGWQVQRHSCGVFDPASAQI